MKFRLPLVVLCIISLIGAPGIAQQPATKDLGRKLESRRTGRVRVEKHCLVDDKGPFLGLGVSYLTALWRCKHDRARLKVDLEFLSQQGFNYFRMLSMVGHNRA